MVLSVDQKKCIGCGACAALCPDCFEMISNKSHVKKDCKCDSSCKEAAEACPVGAINV